MDTRELGMDFGERRDRFLAQIGKRRLVMGILNTTPNSFSDGGKYLASDKALAQAEVMIASGCDIVDVGGKSTRPGATPVGETQEWARVEPVLTRLAARHSTPISIDTYKAAVALRASALGAVVVNDIWGLQKDRDMASVIARTGAAAVLMHNREFKDENLNLVADMFRYFDRSLDLARQAGIDDRRIMLDPGVGFGKSAFRAPSTGELYYPFSGNPSLRPEKSNGYELGLEKTLGGGLVAEVSGFWNDLRDLIDFDAVTFTSQNIGSARTRGVEVVLRAPVGPRSFVRASYTYLDAKDLDTNSFLLRRPRHRASATCGTTFVSGGSVSLTAMWVGARPDRDAVDFTQLVENPSYLRVDTALTLPPLLFSLAPFVRVTNLLGRDYAEASGFPAPGRRFLAGLEAAF